MPFKCLSISSFNFLTDQNHFPHNKLIEGDGTMQMYKLSSLILVLWIAVLSKEWIQIDGYAIKTRKVSESGNG